MTNYHKCPPTTPAPHSVWRLISYINQCREFVPRVAGTGKIDEVAEKSPQQQLKVTQQ
jgi:hypothetical protein